jgi:hypothetical protein
MEISFVILNSTFFSTWKFLLINIKLQNILQILSSYSVHFFFLLYSLSPDQHINHISNTWCNSYIIVVEANWSCFTKQKTHHQETLTWTTWTVEDIWIQSNHFPTLVFVLLSYGFVFAVSKQTKQWKVRHYRSRRRMGYYAECYQEHSRRLTRASDHIWRLHDSIYVRFNP